MFITIECPECQHLEGHICRSGGYRSNSTHTKKQHKGERKKSAQCHLWRIKLTPKSHLPQYGDFISATNKCSTQSNRTLCHGNREGRHHDRAEMQQYQQQHHPNKNFGPFAALTQLSRTSKAKIQREIASINPFNESVKGSARLLHGVSEGRNAMCKIRVHRQRRQRRRRRPSSKKVTHF